MPQSLAKVIVHIVYSTKHRQPWLHDPTLRSELHAYSTTILEEEVDSPAISINSVEDHIHILCLLSRKFAIMDVIKKSKTETSKWIKKQGTARSDFHWQAGYLWDLFREPVKRRTGQTLHSQPRGTPQARFIPGRVPRNLQETWNRN